jgi:hypothetical protein
VICFRFGPPAKEGMETARTTASAVQSIARLTLIDLATDETNDPADSRLRTPAGQSAICAS